VMVIMMMVMVIMIMIMIMMGWRCLMVLDDDPMLWRRRVVASRLTRVALVLHARYGGGIGIAINGGGGGRQRQCQCQ
jgi:hypothetical protein